MQSCSFGCLSISTQAWRPMPLGLRIFGRGKRSLLSAQAIGATSRRRSHACKKGRVLGENDTVGSMYTLISFIHRLFFPIHPITTLPMRESASFILEGLYHCACSCNPNTGPERASERDIPILKLLSPSQAGGPNQKILQQTDRYIITTFHHPHSTRPSPSPAKTRPSYPRNPSIQNSPPASAASPSAAP